METWINIWGNEKMKIFLVFLAINDWQNKNHNYGLWYISAVLKNVGHEVSYIYLNNNKQIKNFYNKISNERPRIIAFSVTTNQFSYLKPIVENIKEISDSFVICGGAHVTLKPESILEIPQLDGIARGEGEYPLLELARALEKKRNYLKIKNFWFRHKNKIIKNKIRPLIENLDELPFPDKTCLNYQKMIDIRGGIAPFIFSRGCMFNCSYCANKALSDVYPNKHKYFRVISPKRAIKEIKNDLEKYNFKLIAFEDDAVSLDKNWFYEFFNLYKKEIRLPFTCNARIDTIDSQMLRLLKEAGIIKIKFGVENGNEDFRKKILNRHMSNKQIINTYQLCKMYKIETESYIMVGLPNETKKDFFDTVRLCRKIGGKFDLSIFHPYPGTELNRICQKNKWMPNKKFFHERKEAVINYPNFSKEEIQICKDEFYGFIKYSKFISPQVLLLSFKTARLLKNIIHSHKKNKNRR